MNLKPKEAPRMELIELLAGDIDPEGMLPLFKEKRKEKGITFDTIRDKFMTPVKEAVAKLSPSVLG